MSLSIPSKPARPRYDATDIKAALRGREVAVIESFLGPHNRKQSSRRDVRWGARGSLSLCTEGRKAGTWFDHESGSGGDLITFVQRETGRTFEEALEYLAGFVGGMDLPSVPVIRITAEKDPDDAVRSEKALQIWADVRPLRGTLAERYLQSRCIEVPDEACDVLGFHPRCPFGHRERHPALVALIQDITTGEPIGVHRTALTPEGRKLDRRVLGPKAGGAIKLGKPADELLVGEGVETVLSARHLGFEMPAWSLIDAGNLERMPIVSGVTKLHIATDNDASGAGRRAAEACRARWITEADVFLIEPPDVGDDLNDYLMKQRGVSK